MGYRVCDMCGARTVIDRLPDRIVWSCPNGDSAFIRFIVRGKRR